MKSTSGLFYSKHSYLCNKKDYLPLLRVQIKSFHLMIRFLSIIQYNFYFLFSKFDFSARHWPFSNVKCVGCSFTSSMTIMQWRSKWPGFTEGPVTTGKNRMPRKTGKKEKNKLLYSSNMAVRLPILLYFYKFACNTGLGSRSGKVIIF